MSLINREDLIAEYDRVHVGTPGGARKLMVDAPEVKPEPHWIPCSERSPEEYGNYLVTTHDGNVDIGTIDPKNKNMWTACDADGFYWLGNVVAWMPLPEPYQEEGEQNGQTSGKPD